MLGLTPNNHLYQKQKVRLPKQRKNCQHTYFILLACVYNQSIIKLNLENFRPKFFLTDHVLLAGQCSSPSIAYCYYIGHLREGCVPLPLDTGIA